MSSLHIFSSHFKGMIRLYYPHFRAFEWVPYVLQVWFSIREGAFFSRKIVLCGHHETILFTRSAPLEIASHSD